jgi:hypothetical protein
MPTVKMHGNVISPQLLQHGSKTLQWTRVEEDVSTSPGLSVRLAS